MRTIARVKYSNPLDSPEAVGVNNITAVFTGKESHERVKKREQRLYLSNVDFSAHHLYEPHILQFYNVVKYPNIDVRDINNILHLLYFAYLIEIKILTVCPWIKVVMRLVTS